MDAKTEALQQIARMKTMPDDVVNRFTLFAAKQIAERALSSPEKKAEPAITSAELIKRTGGDSTPLHLGTFPPEMREPSPYLTRQATEDEAQRGLNDIWPGDPYPVAAPPRADLEDEIKRLRSALAVAKATLRYIADEARAQHVNPGDALRQIAEMADRALAGTRGVENGLR